MVHEIDRQYPLTFFYAGQVLETSLHTSTPLLYRLAPRFVQLNMTMWWLQVSQQARVDAICSFTPFVSGDGVYLKGFQRASEVCLKKKWEDTTVDDLWLLRPYQREGKTIKWPGEFNL
jgi:hypothetical protein